MTVFARARHTPPLGARVLARDEWAHALRLAQRDPVSYILAITHIEQGLDRGTLSGELWGFPQEGPLEAACWAGANLIPIVPGSEFDAELARDALAAFAQLADQSPRRSSSIVGPKQLVLPLWESLDGSWRRPREVRASQPSMAISGPPLIEPDPTVRLARESEFDLVLPASVHMFIEEVGVSPLAFGSAQYAARVRELISASRTLVSIDSRAVPGADLQMASLQQSGLRLSGQDPAPIVQETVTFKADFGAVISEVAQVQGVWVNPRLRGRGLAAPGMAAVVAHGLTHVAPTISLYVNDYNHRALSVYRKVGFEQVGEYATVLY